MLPNVVVYNSVSVDGAIKDFDVNIALHYEVLGGMGADALLAGSNTAKTGIELFMKTVPPEEPSDFFKHTVEADDERPLWVIADSRGILEGLMHVHRKSGYAKDIIMLVSNRTPKNYLEYLADRNYDYITTGEEHIDYRIALEELSKRYGIKTIVTDSGGVLAGVLIDAGLVDEIRLLIAPEIVGKKAVNLFRSLNRKKRLELIRVENIKGHALLVYRIPK